MSGNSDDHFVMAQETGIEAKDDEIERLCEENKQISERCYKELERRDEQIESLRAEVAAEKQKISDLKECVSIRYTQIQEGIFKDNAIIERLREELAAQTELTPKWIGEAAVTGADYLRLRYAVEALGAMPEGYCFCSKDRDPLKGHHEPECADLRRALDGEEVSDG